MTDEVIWCECSKGKSEGYTNLGNQFWVHKPCLKPTFLFWVNQVLIHKYWAELDPIVERIIEKRELEDGLDKGRAEMACLMIGMLLRPHRPDPEAVRDEALKRYRMNHARI